MPGIEHATPALLRDCPVFKKVATVPHKPKATINMHESTHALDNGLLRSMTEPCRNRILAHAEVVSFAVEQVICEEGRRVEAVYFPLDLVVSLLHTTSSGSSSEIAMVGNDGMLGASVCLSPDCASVHAIALCAGRAIRVRAQAIRDELSRSESLQQLFLRHVQALMDQAMLMAACHRHHSIDHQLSRLLLMSSHWLGTAQLLLTQELMAYCLGVRRESVTEAACRLQSAGIVSYHRGRIEIRDRSRLERSSCECYGVLRGEAGDLFTVHGLLEAA